jgi:hypothetical protein
MTKSFQADIKLSYFKLAQENNVVKVNQRGADGV